MMSGESAGTRCVRVCERERESARGERQRHGQSEREDGGRVAVRTLIRLSTALSRSGKFGIISRTVLLSSASSGRASDAYSSAR
jgi:hypothetical protein